MIAVKIYFFGGATIGSQRQANFVLHSVDGGRRRFMRKNHTVLQAYGWEKLGAVVLALVGLKDHWK